MGTSRLMSCSFFPRIDRGVAPMKTLILFLALVTVAAAIPPIRITNREYPDGSGSSRETDPSKQQSVETFYETAYESGRRVRRMTHKVIYKLDERLQPM